MSRREIIENDIVERWLAYDQSVAVKDMQAAHEYRHDICLLLAYLLNTYLDADESFDWRGTWADRLLDAEIESRSSGVRTASGLMVCGDRDAIYMHLTPFRSEFQCAADFHSLESYELWFAAEGPWDRPGTPLVVPFTKDVKARQVLRDSLGPEDSWATVYRKS